MKKSFTLLELTVVIIIIGILAIIALPNFYRPKEHALGKEAIANLKFIAAAEKFYRMEKGAYFPLNGSSVTNITEINRNLRLELNNANWIYYINQGNTTFTAYANRTGSGGYLDCSYNITPTDSEPSYNSTLCP